MFCAGSKVHEAIACISATVPSLCPNRLKYLNVLRDILAFVCDPAEQQGSEKFLHAI